jgi:integrase
VLQPAARAVGLGRVTWHQFRHIHSSLLNNLNVPLKIAQEQLGHASISTTFNIYTHAVDASHRKAIEVVDRELFVIWTTVDYKRRQRWTLPRPSVPL